MDKIRTTNRVPLENFNLNREMDLVIGSKSNSSPNSSLNSSLNSSPTKTNTINSQYLNDRDMFNKFSNENEQIDMTTVKHDEFNYGMPVFNGQILNNKKSLITSPYMMENNKKDNFVSNNITLDSNDMYEKVISKSDNPYTNLYGSGSEEFNDNTLNSMAYNNNSLKTEDIKSNEYICKVEKDITEFEYEINKNKDKEFLVDINSPFALGYLWKTLVLLSKNPTTDKLLKLLGIKNKDNLISDMKYNAEVFDDSGSLEIVLPIGNQTINTNFISKLSSIYKVNVKTIPNNYDNKAQIFLNWLFKIEIPFYYQPIVKSNNLIGYDKNLIKFIEMTNVPVSLSINHDTRNVILEIPCGSNMILGFVYNTYRQNVDVLPYRLMLNKKEPDVLVKKLIIPKINRNKKSQYGKKFKNEIESVHLGEMVYGMMYELDINIHMGLTIDVSKEISKEKYEIKRNIDLININHKCYYYIRNNNIDNKILSNGMINYR